jgi:hypothetical protein
VITVGAGKVSPILTFKLATKKAGPRLALPLVFGWVRAYQP